MMKINQLLITSILILGLISGCASGRQMEYSKVNSIQKHVTTEAQITQVFGEPTQTTTSSDSEIKKIVYIYSTNNGFGRRIVGTTGSIAVGRVGGAINPVFGVVGSIAGSTAGNAAVSPSGEKQKLEISIDTTTGVVREYTFIENKTN